MYHIHTHMYCKGLDTGAADPDDFNEVLLWAPNWNLPHRVTAGSPQSVPFECFLVVADTFRAARDTPGTPRVPRLMLSCSF